MIISGDPDAQARAGIGFRSMIEKAEPARTPRKIVNRPTRPFARRAECSRFGRTAAPLLLQVRHLCPLPHPNSSTVSAKPAASANMP